jgi:prepilin-type N-terminal cleavage/methylation domain-containing protein
VSVFKFNYTRESGFTLVEIMAAIAIMSVFTVVALTGMTNVVDDARFSQTVREMEQIRNAFVGETQRLETGLRKNYGYLGDMGTLPTSAQGIGALSTQPGSATAWSINATYGIGTGWKGPYISNTFDQDFTKDAWGTNYVYDNTISGSTGQATITSYGSNKVVGGSGYAADIVITIPASVTKGNLLGYVVRTAGDLLGADQRPYSGDAEIRLYYPNGNGSIMSSALTITSVNSGRYTFSDIPLGFAALKIFIPDFATASAPNILGPSLVEVNKAAAAATPVAQDETSIYGASSHCTGAENITISATTSSVYFSADTTNNTIAFTLNVPADYTWSTFRYEQERGSTLNYFTISNSSTAMRSYTLNGAQVETPGAGTPMTNGVAYTMSGATVSAGLNSFVFKYGTAGAASDEVFYYQIGCQFIGLPGPGDPYRVP